MVGNSLKAKYGEGKSFNNINVRIEGTGSDLGLMRLQSDVISKNPDMVFIEFAVNDNGKKAGPAQMESMVKTFQEMEGIPYVIFTIIEALTGTEYKRYHQQVADFYGIPVVDLDTIISTDSSVNLSDLLVDATHPNDTGYAYYANAINKVLENPLSFVKPEKKATKLSEDSKAVDIRTIDAADFEISGTSGTYYDIIDGKVFMYTPGTTITAKYTGDMIATRDYIWNNGGKYSIKVDGIDFYKRDTYYKPSDSKVLNLGYIEMGLPFREHTVTITMLEGGAVDSPKVLLGYLYYNGKDDNGNTTVIPGKDAYSAENPIKARSYYSSSGIAQDNSGLTDNAILDCIGNTNIGKWLCYRDVDLLNGVGAIHMTYSSGGSYGGRAQFRIRSTTGSIIAEFTGESPGGWSTYKEFTVNDIQNNVYDTVDLYVTLEGENYFVSLKSVFFEKPRSAADTLGVSNVDYLNKLNIEDTYIRDNDLADSCIIWNVVDFGNEERLMTVTATYAVPESYAGAAIECRLDAFNSELIGRVVMQATGGWNDTNMASTTVPLLKGVTGTHDVYMRIIATEERPNKAGNFKSFSFADAEGNYLINSINNKASYDCVMIAQKEAGVTNVSFITAVYNKDGKLISASLDSKEPADGVTVFNTGFSKTLINGLTDG